MTTPTPNLSDLLMRVEGATGPDRELDVAIHNTFLGSRFPPGAAERAFRQDGSLREYTASLDSALALVERVLPGWRWGRTLAGLMFVSGPNRVFFSATGTQSPTLALLAALLRALISQKASEDV